jgi:hypothetical protein
MDMSSGCLKKWSLEVDGDEDFGVIFAEDIQTAMQLPRIRAQK